MAKQQSTRDRYAAPGKDFMLDRLKEGAEAATRRWNWVYDAYQKSQTDLLMLKDTVSHAQTADWALWRHQTKLTHLKSEEENGVREL